MTAESDNNPGAHRDAATAIARQRATPWRVNLCLARASPSCIALRAGSLLAAPSGPSAMCFLRHARGFGWLDPSLRRRSRRLLDTKAASPRKWDMRGRCPSRIHDPRGSAKEGSTVVSTVKHTRAATSSITKLRLLRPSCPDLLEPRIAPMNTNNTSKENLRRSRSPFVKIRAIRG